MERVFGLSILTAIFAIAIFSCKKTENTPTPTISGFSPLEAQHGTEITITGENFSASLSGNSVKFNDVAAVVISAKTTELKVVVPKNLDCTGHISVTVADKTAVSEVFFNYLPVVFVSTLAGSGEQGLVDGQGAMALFNYPQGITVDASGILYVGEYLNHSIRKITPTGMVSTFVGNGFPEIFKSPNGLAVDVSGNVYVADWVNNRIRKITPVGVVSTLAGNEKLGFADGAGTEAQFHSPNGVAVDASGNVYVTDCNNHLIRKITSTGVVSTLAGKSGHSSFADGPGATALFCGPFGVAVDASGNIYVAENCNNRIRKITPVGLVSTLAGNGTAGFADGPGATAQFHSPLKVTVDASNNVYVADWNNHRIRKIIQE